MEVGGQLYAAGKNTGNLNGTQSRFGRLRKISPPPEFDPRNVHLGGRGSTVVKVLCYKSEGRWFDPS